MKRTIIHCSEYTEELICLGDFVEGDMQYKSYKQSEELVIDQIETVVGRCWLQSALAQIIGFFVADDKKVTLISSRTINENELEDDEFKEQYRRMR